MASCSSSKVARDRECHTELAEYVDDGCRGKEWRLDVGIDEWCRPTEQWAMFERAAAALTEAIDHRFRVRS